MGGTGGKGGFVKLDNHPPAKSLVIMVFEINLTTHQWTINNGQWTMKKNHKPNLINYLPVFLYFQSVAKLLYLAGSAGIPACPHSREASKAALPNENSA